ncbi:MAG: Kelch repeat-containing protein [Gemmataceae bacterium]
MRTLRVFSTLVATLFAIQNLTAADRTFPDLPKGISSFGAVACDGYLYVYGGHAGKTHSYDTETVLGTFQRLKIDGGMAWETLPGGPGLQGMNLAAHGGKILRVGGMEPRNAPGKPTDNHSVPSAAMYDPAKKEWVKLPDMPAGRSSHDLVVVGNQLIVVGGWNQAGNSKPVWHTTALELDLSASKPEWKTLAQPFARRALTATVLGSKVYVVGGLTAEGLAPEVNVYDALTKKWSKAEELPGSDRSAFSPAAATVDGAVIVNTNAGLTYRLSSDDSTWEKIGTSSKRMVARLIPASNTTAILLGGAGGMNGNHASLELLKLR